jgi:hypothetical protein
MKIDLRVYKALILYFQKIQQKQRVPYLWNPFLM